MHFAAFFFLMCDFFTSPNLKAPPGIFGFFSSLTACVDHEHCSFVGWIQASAEHSTTHGQGSLGAPPGFSLSSLPQFLSLRMWSLMLVLAELPVSSPPLSVAEVHGHHGAISPPISCVIREFSPFVPLWSMGLHCSHTERHSPALETLLPAWERDTWLGLKAPSCSWEDSPDNSQQECDWGFSPTTTRSRALQTTWMSLQEATKLQMGLQLGQRLHFRLTRSWAETPASPGQPSDAERAWDEEGGAVSCWVCGVRCWELWAAECVGCTAGQWPWMPAPR